MFNMAPKLSICIPTYNRSNYLKMCLNSVLSSEYENLEVIVSDNASQDNTTEIVNSFSDKRLKYIRNEKNIGIELNILNVIANSTGDFIFFLTDDDLLNDSAISQTIQIIQEHPDVGVIMSKMNILDDKTNEKQKDYTFHNDTILFDPGKDALLGLFHAAHVLSRCTIRRDLIDVEGYKRHIGTLYPQIYIIGRALKKAPSVYVDTAFITHRINNQIHWGYSDDYMASGIIKIIKDITRDEEYCRTVRKKLINYAIAASYNALASEKRNSYRAYSKLVLAYLQIPEYKRSMVFWIHTFLIFLLGASVGEKICWCNESILKRIYR